MFKYLGRWSTHYAWVICILWLATGLVISAIAPSWDGAAHDDDIRFLPPRCDSVRGYQLLQQAFPEDVFASKVIFVVERTEGKLTDPDLALVDQVVADLNQLRQSEPGLQINRVISHRDPFLGNRLLSEDGQCTLIQVSLNTPYLAEQTRATVDRAEQVVRQRWEQTTETPTLFVSGPAGVGRDLATAGGNSLDDTTLATILLVVIILLFVHRAPLLALIPLVTIAGSVFIALKVLALCTLIPGFYLVNVSKIFAIVMLYGAGTDYCLFLISRYREELGAGHDQKKALARSVKGVGGALTASAATVICGLGLMGLAEFAKVRCAGPAIAVSLLVALIASLTLAPALLSLLGPWVFWPTGVPQKQTEENRHDIWTSLSKQVTRRPVLIWATAVLLLLPLALVGLNVKTNYRPTGELSRHCSSVQGLDAIQRHFTAGEVGPITVLLQADRDWDSPEGREVIDHLSRGFGNLENVAEVRSLTQPLGNRVEEPVEPPKPAPQNALLARFLTAIKEKVDEQFGQSAADFYVSPVQVSDASGEQKPTYVTRLDVVLHSDPFDEASNYTLDLIQLWVSDLLPESTGGMGEVRAETYGVTVNSRDLASITESDRLRINTMVLGGIFLILLILVRNPWLAGYLLLTVLFSYYATLGATTIAAHFWSGRPLGVVDWRVPFFLFTILVAVGEDYNILLISRTLKERKRHGAKKGTELALARTGGTITSCGLIMAGTFATLMLAGLNTLVQVGFALAFGVLLDTFVIRPFLVPAFTYWVWKQQEGEEQPEPANTIIPYQVDRSYRRAG